MTPIKNFLARFKLLTVPDEGVRKKVVEICAAEFKVPLEMKDVRIRQHVLYIQASPHAKMTLYTQKKPLLERLRIELGKDAPTDIR